MAFATIEGTVDYAKRGGKGYTVIEEWTVAGKPGKRRWAVWFEEETPLVVGSTVKLTGALSTKIGDPWEKEGQTMPGGIEHTINKARFVDGPAPVGVSGGDQWNTPAVSDEVPF